ncbi:MAG: hypothetical protein K6F79_00640 [Saccharofermentans sp.]|nr:hypothetical protein [Saccharofermentans sp.]
MATSYANMNLKMPTEYDYKVMKIIVEQNMDDEDLYPVEEYDEKYRWITFEESTGDTKDNVIEIAQILDKAIESLVADSNGEIKEVEFTLECTIRYSNDAFEDSYLVERSEEKLTIKKSSYVFISSIAHESYSDLMEQVEELLEADPRKLLKEEDYNENDDYYFSEKSVSAYGPNYGRAKNIRSK